MPVDKQKTVLHLGEGVPGNSMELLSGLADLGWQVHLISHKTLKPGNHRGIILHSLPLSPCYPLSYAAIAFATPKIISIKPDIIHAHHLTSYGIMAAVYRRFLRFKPMILSTYGEDVVLDTAKGMTRWSAEHAVKMFEAVIAENSTVYKALLQMKLPADQLHQLSIHQKGTAAKAAVEELSTLYNGLIRHNRT